MITISRKVINMSCGLLAALALSAFGAMPASAHAVRHHHYYGKTHVNVNVNLRGGYGYRHNRYYPPARVVYVAPPRRACTRVRRDGWYRGYPALVSNRVCYNAYGEAYVQPGTKRLVHYY